mmetsp:Transcript_4416/g.12041  ORF Transcript_4416/g.12041 Transcript_4416/m.12041 type:complete len:281 (-) Transcript_4416:7-849(-)
MEIEAMRSKSRDSSFGGNFGGGAIAEQIVTEKERQFMMVHKSGDMQLEQYQEEVARLANCLHVQHVATEHARESLSRQLAGTRDSVMRDLYKQRTERHMAETRLEQLSDTYVADARGSLAEEEKLQEESRRYTRDVQAEICNLYSDIARAHDFRVEKGRKLAEGVSGKLDEIREAITAERRIRDESEKTLLELFGQMGSRIDQEIENARQERIAAGERLTALVDSASSILAGRGKGAANRHFDGAMEENSDGKTMVSNAIEMSKRRSTMALGGRNSIMMM